METLVKTRVFDAKYASALSVYLIYLLGHAYEAWIQPRHPLRQRPLRLPDSTGPTVTDAVFLNKEEVDLVPIYYDPVHDFGFLRFDPKTVKFLDVAEIELNPEGAKVGVEIRVVGNDSGEKLR